MKKLLNNKGEYKAGKRSKSLKVRVHKGGKEMEDSDLRAVLAAARQTAIPYSHESSIAEERKKSLSYYRGEKLGNERPGRSSVISRDVMDCVETVLPELVEVFLSSDDVVEFEHDEDAASEKAQQATAYCNYEFMRENPGFMILMTAFKTALIQKNGIVKVCWEDNEKKEIRRHRRVNLLGLMDLIKDEDVTILQQRAYTEAPTEDGDEVEEIELTDEQLDSIPEESLLEEVYYDLVLCRYTSRGKNAIYNVAPEHFFISPRAGGLWEVDKPEYCGDECEKSASELVAMFPDKAKDIEHLPGYSNLEFGGERTKRFDDDQSGMDYAVDESMRQILMTDWYIYIDFDGDGIAEYRHIVTAGENIDLVLLNEEIDDHPYADFCPVPEPHRFHGHSYGDLVMDIQLIKTTILRQLLDNMYQANNKRFWYIPSMLADPNALFDNRPFTHIPVKTAGAIGEIQSGQLGGDGLSMYQLMDQLRETRTGVYRASRGMDVDRLHDTAQGIDKLMDKQDKRTMLVARVFAETGMKRIFRLILANSIKFGDEKRRIEIDGKRIEVDPRAWNAEMKMKINVGLGTGNRQERVRQIMAILEMQIAAASRVPGMVDAMRAYNAIVDAVRALDKKTPERYFINPESPEYKPPQPQPSEKVQIASMQNATKQQEITLEHQRQTARDRFEAQLGMKKLEIEARKVKGGDNDMPDQRMGGKVDV